MERNKNIFLGENIKSISTSDIDELSSFQVNKNRRYIQLQPGLLKARYLEANIGGIQIFREELSAGAFFEAAPHSSFLPFAALLCNSQDFTYCGKLRQKNTILQASGGFWDASFKNNLEYVVAAFDRSSFSRDIERLTNQEIPHNWLISKASLTDPLSLDRYARGLNYILNLIQKNPEILAKKNAIRMLSDHILKLVFDVLITTSPQTEKLSGRSNRLLGVRKVIDYLHSYYYEIPTIPELCKIANLCERSLQYGFKEYLNITPVRYLRLVRLNGVRRELLFSHPQKNKVVDVALNWGFVELGRFAGEYRKLFDELPSATLNMRNELN